MLGRAGTGMDATSWLYLVGAADGLGGSAAGLEITFAGDRVIDARL